MSQPLRHRWLGLALGLGLATLCSANDSTAATPAPQPLYRDPGLNGAADPVVIWNPTVQRWWMFYTNRRANIPGLSGVAWVHGTRIGIAESADDGVTWSYVGPADIDLPAEVGGTTPTQWAPDVLTGPDGTHHMFLTVVPGIFEDWRHLRHIVHLTSDDLRTWDYRDTLPLATDRAIDADVQPLPNGGWRLWYNDERAGKAIAYADSPDLTTWTDHGRVASLSKIPGGEGPVVFPWQGKSWMLVDHWRGLGVYHSDDLSTWTPQAGDFLLAQPGHGPDDGINGGHADVVVTPDGTRAFLFYFTHPGRAGTISPEDPASRELRRSSILVTELHVTPDGRLTCDRDQPTFVDLGRAPLTNPLIKQRADPHIHQHTDGYYYFMGTVPEYDRLELRRAPTIAGLATAEPKTIWTKHATGPMGAHIWAPEIHFLDGKWFIYFAAGEAEKVWNIRIYVLENDSPNPLEGEWIERGQIDTGWESFALDATIFADRGTRYLLWAQHDDAIGGNTNLYIAPMATPTKLAGPAVLLSRPDYAWEKVRYAVNEGPVILRGPDKLFLTYSAAGTGAEYCLGMLTADAQADLLDPASWTKSPVPVFQTSEANHIYGPGHHTFTKAEDGITDLLVYHARSYRDIIGDPLRDPNRHTRVQTVHWREDGTPDFGTPRPDTPSPPVALGAVALTDLRARDACIYPDPATGTYLMYFAAGQRGPNGRPAVVAYRSRDLKTWEGPNVVFEKPATWWADRGIWAPEMHPYQGKYYLFLTFDSTHEFPEQWHNWRPRVQRGSQILVADSPLGPFLPFANAPALPIDMMTLDGTLWIEDGVPYLVFCHEWVQIKDGTVEMIPLKPDLSGTIGEPTRLFHGSDAPWAIKSAEYGSTVTDGCWLYRTQTGKLLMLWSSFGAGDYTVGIAESTSGKLAGPWVQHREPLYTSDGGHPMLFRRFDGQLMLALHTPNKPPREREAFFEVVDEGNTLRLRHSIPE